MSSTSGQATSPLAFFNQLVGYLTANTTLKASSGLWSQVWQASDTEIVLQAPSVATVADSTANHADSDFSDLTPSQSAPLYVGLKLVTNTGTQGGYALALYGMSGILAGAAAVEDHVNVSEPVWMYLDNSTMNYWITASARRFMCIVQISTIFESCYAGLFLPFGDPLYYAYPYAIGGSSSGNPNAPQTYRAQTGAHSNFINPYSWNVENVTPSLYIMDPSGTWLPAKGDFGDLPVSSYVGVGPNNYVAGVDPDFGVVQGGGTITDVPVSGLGYENFMPRLVPFYDGTVSLQEITLCQSTGGVLGTLDGILRISGKSAAAADTITMAGSNYIVAQNGYRTDENSFFAMLLDAGIGK